MRFSIDRANLVRACSHLAGVFAERTTIPILNNVMIEVHDEKATFTGNNLSQSLSITVPARVEEKGATTVEFHRLKSIADVSPDGAEVDIACDGEDGHAVVRAGRSRYKLFVLPATDFPIFEFPADPTRFALRGAEFDRLLTVGYMAPEDDARPYLNGIYLHRRDRVILGVATDGHRLAYAEVPVPGGAENVYKLGVILPNAAIKILKGLVSDDEAAIETDGRKLAVTFERGGMSIIFATKLVDGTYPDFERIIPPRSNRTFVVAAETMLLAIKRAMIMTDGRSTAIRINLDEGKCAVSARADAGSAADEVDCDWAADQTEIFVNGRYLVAALANMDAKEVCFTVQDGHGPIRVEVPGDDSRLDVIMPMRG